MQMSGETSSGISQLLHFCIYIHSLIALSFFSDLSDESDAEQGQDDAGGHSRLPPPTDFDTHGLDALPEPEDQALMEIDGMLIITVEKHHLSIDPRPATYHDLICSHSIGDSLFPPDIGPSNAVVLHDDKKYYPLASGT